MTDGDAFTPQQVAAMTAAAEAAAERSGLRFSVFVGPSEGDPSSHAERLLAALGDEASRSVVVHVDPAAERVEIVTGRGAAQHLDERACRLAAESMTPSFRAGDIPEGVSTGLRVLGDAVFWSAASST